MPGTYADTARLIEPSGHQSRAQLSRSITMLLTRRLCVRLATKIVHGLAELNVHERRQRERAAAPTPTAQQQPQLQTFAGVGSPYVPKPATLGQQLRLQRQ